MLHLQGTWPGLSQCPWDKRGTQRLQVNESGELWTLGHPSAGPGEALTLSSALPCQMLIVDFRCQENVTWSLPLRGPQSGSGGQMHSDEL